MSAPSPNETFHAAQRLIRSGQPIFPCRATGAKAKAPMTKNGVYDATLSVAQAKAWWRRHGDAAIGIPTGVLWDVLDVDVKRNQDGRVYLPRLAELGLLNGCQQVVRTPSGGWHLYFPHKPGHENPNTSRADLGLDVRSKGGYVLASPSYIEVENGADSYSGVYEDIGATTEATNEPLYWGLILSALAPVNAQTKESIQLLSYEKQRSIASLRHWLSERVPGERNSSLHWAVCRCIENGIDPHELTEVALLIGLGEVETEKTINSALRRAGVIADDLDTEAEALFPVDG